MRILSLLLFMLLPSIEGFSQAGEAALLNKLRYHVYYLSDDSLKGRATGSTGEDMALRYISGEFGAIGLEKRGEDNSYIQTFDFPSGRQIAGDNYLKINRFTFQLNEDYFPLVYSGTGEVGSEVIDVDYGIIAPELEHDDYKKLDETLLEGRVFLIALSSPEGYHPHTKYYNYAGITDKITTAIEKGAAAIIFYNHDENYEVPGLQLDQKVKPYDIPILYITRNAFEKIDGEYHLKTILKVELKDVRKYGKNVIGYINNNAERDVVIGAHYDHLGMGEVSGSLYRGEEAAVHNGADDNASGTALVIELARQLKDHSAINNHNFMFIAFSGEELGLYGSSYFTKNPTIDLDDVNFMINFDMVGRLDTAKGLAINGTGTSPGWDSLIHHIDVSNLTVKTTESGIGPSDHTSFYLKDIPVLHFFTGTHQDYHKPTDDADKVNFEGIVSISEYVMALIDSLDGQPYLTFTKTKDESNENVPRFTVTLGVVPDYMFEEKGMRIEGISEGKPAEAAGLQSGDVVIKLGDHEVTDMMSYMKALSKFKKGDATTVTVVREKKQITKDITF